MMTKTLLEVFLVTIFVSFVACKIATKRCTKQSDCNVPKECCSMRFLEQDAYCVPRRRLGEICLDGSLSEVMMNNTYSITCPCEVGLSCIKEEWYNGNGELLYQRNPRCREASWEQPSLESYIGGNAIDTGYRANAYANIASYGNVVPYGNTGSYASSSYNNANPGAYAFQYRRK